MITQVMKMKKLRRNRRVLVEFVILMAFIGKVLCQVHTQSGWFKHCRFKMCIQMMWWCLKKLKRVWNKGILTWANTIYKIHQFSKIKPQTYVSPHLTISKITSFLSIFSLFIAQYLQKMVNNDQEAYNLLSKINQFVKNNDIDHRKFESLKIAVLPEKTSFIQFGKEKLT